MFLSYLSLYLSLYLSTGCLLDPIPDVRTTSAKALGSLMGVGEAELADLIPVCIYVSIYLCVYVSMYLCVMYLIPLCIYVSMCHVSTCLFI
jgi:hypothetical protein